VTMARFSSDSIVICYVLLVLWMTSCFHTMGPTGGWTDTALSTSSPVATGGVQAAVGRPAASSQAILLPRWP